MLTSASSHLHLLFVAYAFFRLPALLVEHFLALVIVVDLLTCAGKIFPGGYIGVFHVLAEVSKHLSSEGHVKIVHDALLPRSSYHLRGEAPDGTMPFHDEVGDFVRPGNQPVVWNHFVHQTILQRLLGADFLTHVHGIGGSPHAHELDEAAMGTRPRGDAREGI